MLKSARSAHWRRGVYVAIVLGAAWLSTTPTRAQFERTISTTYDGWSQLPDGSYDLVFGYMNRNPSEVEVALGAANVIEPAPADQGQPVNFLPGRQRDAFRIHVPRDFKGKFVWTLSYAGTTQTATGSLDQNYSLDVGDPEPPSVHSGGDRTIRLSESVSLAPVVKAPPPPPPTPENANIVARVSRGARITVWWSKFRGPGTVTFGGAAAPASEGGPTGREFPMGAFRVACPVPLTSTCGATTAKFSAPGVYWLRVVAAERSASNSMVKVTVNP